MSIRTIASTVAATISTLTRARAFVSAAHRVATASVQDARALLDGTIRFAAYALGYQRTAATSPPRPAHPCAPPANAATVKPETAPVSHAPTPVLHELTPASHVRTPVSHAPTPVMTAPPTTTQPQGASNMSELIEAIRVAIAQGATAEQKAIGAQACRTILTALGAEPGKPLVLPGAPKPHPLSGITVDQALDLAIARLTMVADARDKPTATATTVPTAKAATPTPATAQVERRGPRIDLVSPPPRGTATRSTPQRTPQRAPQPVRGKP
jgi:hypothetical protein